MANATKPLANRLAVVFDFDDTLAPDSIDGFVASCGLDPDAFQRERVQPRVADGWNKMLATFYALVEESQRRDHHRDKITRERLVAYGRELAPFEGVPAMFERLRRRVRELTPEVEVEFYLLSSGIAEIARHNRVAGEFKVLWGCEFHYHDDGTIAFVKQFISHTEKTRYLYQIATGLDREEESGRPQAVYDEVPPEELHVPLTQVVYVGDGSSDVPCFAVLNAGGGVALGLYKGDKAQNWESAKQVSAGERVANLAPVDFREGSELMRSLMLAVEKICKQIALRQLSVDE